MSDDDALLFAGLDQKAEYEAIVAAAHRVVRQGPQIGDALVSILRTSTSDVPPWAPHYQAAVHALGLLGPAVVLPLIDLLHDDNVAVRVGAARALGAAQDARAIAPLTHVLDVDLDVRVRHSVINALGEIGQEHEGALEVLLERLDPAHSEIDWVIGDVIEVTGATAVRVLTRAHADHTRSATIREWSASLLGDIRDPRALEVLRQSLLDVSDNLEVRKAAAYSLGVLQRRRAILDLISVAIKGDEDMTLRHASTRALKGRAAIATLHTLLHARGNDMRLRVEAALYLGRTGNSVAETILLEALDDSGGSGLRRIS